MKKMNGLIVMILFGFSGFGQNWATIGGSSEHNGLSSSYGPETVSSEAWSITNASSTMWGGAIYTSGDLFATSRVKFSPSYHVTVECRKVNDGSLLWEKEFPNDGKLYVVGMNEDAVYVHNYATDSLFAFERQTGNIKWVCPEKAMIFGGAHGILFACNGDPVVNGPDTYEKSLMRLNKDFGEPIWYNTNWTSVSPAPDYCIYGDRLYRWEGAIGIPTHLVAVDLETGENLFASDALPGDADQEHPLIAGPDGTIYGQRDGGDLWAFTDEGSSFSAKWFYSPENGGMGTYGNLGIGADGSIYYPDGNVVKRLDPATGQVLNSTGPLSTDPMYGTYITTDSAGTVFISNGEAAGGKYFAFSSDLVTKYWEKPVPYCYYAGPQISRDGIMILAGSGTSLTAYKTSLPHRPVSWFEAADSHILQFTNATFTDMSSLGPETWHWIFEGGIPSESFQQDPGPVKYIDYGVFRVTLITGNQAGTDSLTRECYLEVQHVMGLPGTAKPSEIKVFPNPGDGQFTVELPYSPEDNESLVIEDLYGRVVFQGRISSRKTEINEKLLPGIYFVGAGVKNHGQRSMLIIR